MKHVLIALVTALVTPLILRALFAGHKPGRQSGEYRVCEYGLAYQVTMWVCFVFFVTLSVLAWRFPGRTDPGALKWVILLFMGFAALSLFSLLLAGRSSVYWNEHELEGADMLGRRHRFSWAQLARVDEFPSLMSLRLQAEDGRRIWVAPMMRGFEEFRARLERTGLLPEQPFDQEEDGGGDGQEDH